MSSLDADHLDRDLWQPRLDVGELALEPGLWLSLSTLHYNVETGEILTASDAEGVGKQRSAGLFGGFFGLGEKKHSKNSPSTIFGGLFGKGRQVSSSSGLPGSRINRVRSKS